ncbi:MAG: DNA repair protein RecO [Aeromonadaceae bacterium]
MERQQAFVLHTRPYRESSQLVDLFCAGVGRLTLVARGSRGPRSAQKALLQPFIPLSLSWRGKGELKNLEQLELAGSPLKLQGAALYSALYLNELLYYLLEQHTAYFELFDYYRQALQLLTQEPSPEPVLRQFELLLLEALGYGIDFRHDGVSGLAIEPERDYLYLAECGFVASRGEPGEGPLFRGGHLLAMAEGRFDDPTLLQASKRFCRLALKPYLGNRPLKSRELFQNLTTRRE